MRPRLSRITPRSVYSVSATTHLPCALSVEVHVDAERGAVRFALAVAECDILQVFLSGLASRLFHRHPGIARGEWGNLLQKARQSHVGAKEGAARLEHQVTMAVGSREGDRVMPLAPNSLLLTRHPAANARPVSKFRKKQYTTAFGMERRQALRRNREKVRYCMRTS